MKKQIPSLTLLLRWLLCCSAGVLLHLNALADTYTNVSQAGSSNFNISTTPDANGLLDVFANWNTAGLTSPDYFIGASGSSYNVVIGSNGSLYDVGNGNNNEVGLQTPAHHSYGWPWYTLMMSGSSATNQSQFTNNGTIVTITPTPPTGPSADVVYIENTKFTNNGILGQWNVRGTTDYSGPGTAMQLGPNCVFTNNGLIFGDNGIWSTTGVTGTAPSSPGVAVNTTINNNGLIYTKIGPIMAGNWRINNFQNAGLAQQTNDSYGIQLSAGPSESNPSIANNWGYISASTNGVWFDHFYATFNDYGGPLTPGQEVFDANAGWNLAYGGSVGAQKNTSKPGGPNGGGNANPQGGTFGAICLSSAVAGHTNVTNIWNTVYTVQSSQGGITPVGTLVNCLPMIQGDIFGTNLNNTCRVNLYLDGLTTTQVSDITNALLNGKSYYNAQDTSETYTLKIPIDGAQYSFVCLGQVNFYHNNVTPDLQQAQPPVGVYAGSGASQVFYSGSTQLANAATVRLTGTSSLIPDGNGHPAVTNIEAGWVLRLGSYLSGSGSNDYTGSFTNCTAINIDNGMATAVGYNVNGVVQTGTSPAMPLPGTLVVDNNSTNLSLPLLEGAGNLVQEGKASTTLNGNNPLTGMIYVAHGTLQMASGASMANSAGLVMTSEDSTALPSKYDVSLGTQQAAAWSTLGHGVILNSLQGMQSLGSTNTTSPANFYTPIIALGANNLIIGNNTGAVSCLFQGQVQGTGGVEFSPGSDTVWGGSMGSNNTYSGGTYIDPGATVQVSTFPQYTTSPIYHMFGTGNVTNYGNIMTIAGNVQFGFGQSSTMVAQNASQGGANHVVYVNGNYTQSLGGTLTLNLNSGLLASGTSSFAPGTASDFLEVSGTLALSGTAQLALEDVNPVTLAQPQTIVIASAGALTAGGANVFTLESNQTLLYEGTIFQIGTNSAVIHYGTLPGYANEITLTLFPPGVDAWSSTDIGNVGFAGSTSYLSGTYVLQGSGADVYGAPDAFQFATQELTGTGAIIARVDAVQNTSTWAKAGVMMRDTLDPSAPFADVIITPGQGANFQWRGTGAPNGTQITGIVAPYWVELVRSAGNVFTGYVSPNGSSWTQIGTPQTINMGNTIQAGLAVTAHNNAALCTGTFDAVNFVPGPGWSSQDIGAPQTPGFTGYSGGVESVYASGTSMYGAFDQFRFVYLPVSGTCTITARVSSISNTAPKAKAGLIIRENLSPSSAHMFVFETPTVGVIVQDRLADGNGTTQKAQDSLAAAPKWLRLSRVGPQEIVAYDSTDGITWRLLYDETSLAFSGTGAYIGIAVTGLNATELGAATFDNITVSP